MEMPTIILLVVCGGIAFIALLTAVGLLLPIPVEHALQKLENKRGRSFLLGLINLIFWIFVLELFYVWAWSQHGPSDLMYLIFGAILSLLIAAVTIPGIPALTALAQFLGMRMGESKSPLQRDLRGGLLLVLACLTPYIGWFIFTPAILCTAVGAGLLALFQRKPSPPKV